MDAPKLTLRFALDVLIADPVDFGVTVRGHRRMIAITGGSFTSYLPGGDEVTGTVLPIGADFQTLFSGELTYLSASYVIEDADGQRVLVENTGIRHAEAETIAAINRGERVENDVVYFMTTPVLTSSDERYSWVSSRLFVGKALREPDRVKLFFFEVE